MFLQIEREKLHGCIDVGLSVMSVKKSSKCIDLDTEEHIYHLKVSLLPRRDLLSHGFFVWQRDWRCPLIISKDPANV